MIGDMEPIPYEKNEKAWSRLVDNNFLFMNLFFLDLIFFIL